MPGGSKSRSSRSRSSSRAKPSTDPIAMEASGQPMRIGDLLVRMGVLTPDQRDQVLEAQRSGSRPFGVLAEEMFGVSPGAVERAWASQFAQLAPRIDAATVQAEKAALESVSRRQAWQFRVLPVRFAGSELIVATTQECLPRAMRFMAWRASHEVSFVLSDEQSLGIGLCRLFPMAGMSPDDVPLSRSGCST
ncbi:MAG: hypothetical protein GIKADHBN_02727 [Phycisphaerales bacterium]|nr:hypothetical protein [Phycisphaerales bacterium]MCK6476338.1 hypothetical protein [Phycisphaerales bacterium]